MHQAVLVEETNLFLKTPVFKQTTTMVLMKTFALSVKEVEERIGWHVTNATNGSTWCASACPFCQKMMSLTIVLIAKSIEKITTDFH